MREPAFWYRPPSLLSRLLAPLGAIYGAVTTRRMARDGAFAGLPVLCVGNYHVGGAGKTPATIALVKLLREMGEKPFVVSRGYGGSQQGPVRVDQAEHTAADVGDEPLMMASSVSVIVSRDRVAGAALARAQGASVVLLDDGFQNPALVKDVSLIVIDASRGVGNGGMFPAGPLRAPLEPQIARTDALIVIGAGNAASEIEAAVAKRAAPVLRARLVPDQASVDRLRDQRLLAFAGIGDPPRFFATLRACGVDVAEERTFADHHPFTPEEIERLVSDAAAKSLTLVTTEKDMARIRSDARLKGHADRFATFAVTLDFDDAAMLRNFVAERLAKARAR
ncbi:tetraacyldisaccharide 4'-kinase [Afipia massiliensis]|uniref:Tetraacyldisaccharide 4'-kinase n=1 Tax=Afipia massiliensis TaxID=211460 RepID=A0A840N2U5_9BRAD|nr:tetraacyldisaccharide 4'-kinase [Afipia massiliensis]MBB5052944.1 tetraacyldisaccharide 4'-kinase [Afipia massiliensis]